jgi:putative ABC transport system ATP-binding protein
MSVELIDVHKIYKTKYYEVRAINGITMKIEDGEFIAIMGPSGSGKSTLLYLIGCLDRPTKGEVVIDGVETSELSDDELTRLRREKLGFVFQQYNLISTLTALENVELPMIFRGVPKNERKRKAMELLRLVGIEDIAERKPMEISGGEQQKVAIARAMANEPKILLCDEPTGNLDSKSGRQIMGIIKELNEEKGVTVILVTHDPSMAEFAERIVKLRDGRLQDVP